MKLNIREPKDVVNDLIQLSNIIHMHELPHQDGKASPKLTEHARTRIADIAGKAFFQNSELMQDKRAVNALSRIAPIEMDEKIAEVYRVLMPVM